MQFRQGNMISPICPGDRHRPCIGFASRSISGSLEARKLYPWTNDATASAARRTSFRQSV